MYTSDDEVVEGEIEEGRLYKEADFNKNIEIRQREKKRVQVYMEEANQKEKAIVFCANQPHAALIRDIINQQKRNKDINYCVRVTADDGLIGEQHLKDFQDNEKTIPTILTTSQKLSTGVDARNVRNIVLLRPVNSMMEFKQIIGRGTRLFEGKEFFTIWDYVDAYEHFADPDWDGEPQEPETENSSGEPPPAYPLVPAGEENNEPAGRRQKIKVKLRDGKERELQHMISTSFWSAEGKPISAEEFIENLFGALPGFFKNETELRSIWSNPVTRKTLLERLEEAGYSKDDLEILQRLVNAEKSDLFDVLEYVSFAIQPITREQRVTAARNNILNFLNINEREFVEFVLSKYVESGVEELDQEKLPDLLKLKYHAISDAADALGGIENIKKRFIEFQKYLYEAKVA